MSCAVIARSRLSSSVHSKRCSGHLVGTSGHTKQYRAVVLKVVKVLDLNCTVKLRIITPRMSIKRKKDVDETDCLFQLSVSTCCSTRTPNVVVLRGESVLARQVLENVRKISWPDTPPQCLSCRPISVDRCRTKVQTSVGFVRISAA